MKRAHSHCYTAQFHSRIVSRINKSQTKARSPRPPPLFSPAFLIFTNQTDQKQKQTEPIVLKNHHSSTKPLQHTQRHPPIKRNRLPLPNSHLWECIHGANPQSVLTRHHVPPCCCCSTTMYTTDHNVGNPCPEPTTGDLKQQQRSLGGHPPTALYC